MMNDSTFYGTGRRKRSVARVYLTPGKGNILVNGVSLTISKIKKQSFEIWVIPHTLKLTNLNNLEKNAIVNVEIDILSKYVKKYLNAKN